MGLYKNKLNTRTGQFNLVPSNQVVLFKAGVANFAALPLTGNEQNDARVTNDTHHLYVWSGTAWIDQGDLIDLTWAAIDGKPSSTPANIDDAVSKKHSQNTDEELKFITPAPGDNIITGGVASANNEGGGAAANACDGNITTYWYQTATIPAWWKYDLGVGIAKIGIKARVLTQAGFLKNFTIEGSNNDIDWTLLYTGIHPNAGGWQEFTFANTTAYRYYRYNVIDTYYPPASGCAIFEIEIREAVETITADEIKTKLDDADVSITALETKCNKIGETAAAVNYYVDPILGNDSNPGTDALPFKTIKYALSVIPKLNINYTEFQIRLKSGTYTESPNLISIVGYANCKIQIVSSTYNADNVIINSPITVGSSEGINILNITCQINSNNGAGIATFDSSVYISGCKFRTNGVATNTFGIQAFNSIVNISYCADSGSNKVAYGLRFGLFVCNGVQSPFGTTFKTPNQTLLVDRIDYDDAITKKHDPKILGTKEVSETAIGNKKILKYNSVSGKLEYVIDGMSDIVIPDGFTDEAINAAITTLGVNGGIIYLPVGTYTIDASIVIQADNTIIMGSGWGTSLDCSTLLAAEGQCFDLNGKVHTAFRDFEVVVGYTGQNIKVFHDGNVASPYLLLDNIYIQYPETYSVYAENTGSHSWVIQNCIIDMSQAWGVYLKGAFNRIINNEIFIYDYAPIICGSDTIITGNYLASAGSSILVLGDRCVITGNVMEFGDKSIVLQTGGYATITGNTISGNAYGWGGGRHIEIATSHNIITGNTFTDVQDNYYCIQLNSGASYNAILGNITNGIDGTYQEGLVHIIGTGANYNIITGNNSKNSGTAAVVIDASNSYNQVSWNNFEEETTPITDNGSDNTIVQAKTSNVSFGKDVNIAGELTIKVYTQDNEPVLDTDNKMAIWIDSNDSYKVYLIFKRTTISGLNDQVKVELN